MDKCELCGKEIQEGIQYITAVRTIHLGSRPWCATPAGHYSFCEDCDKSLKLYLNWWKNSQKI